MRTIRKFGVEWDSGRAKHALNAVEEDGIVRARVEHERTLRN